MVDDRLSTAGLVIWAREGRIVTFVRANCKRRGAGVLYNRSGGGDKSRRFVTEKWSFLP